MNKTEEIKKKYPFRMVEVTWMDAQHGTDITHYEDLKQLKPVLTKNVGYLIHHCKEYLILGYMVFDNDYIKHYQLIPNGMVIKMETLCYAPDYKEKLKEMI